MKGLWTLVFVVCVFTACKTQGTQNIAEVVIPIPSVTPEPEPTKPPIPERILNESPEQLCKKLKDIKTLPTFEPTPTDPIYEALIVKGNSAIPCLIENITDKREVPDPRYSVPHWQHFAVGDTAVFIIVDIVGKDDEEREKLLIEMMPAKSQKEWETNGIYAYFNYVSEPKNRKQLQSWWKNWTKQTPIEHTRSSFNGPSN